MSHTLGSKIHHFFRSVRTVVVGTVGSLQNVLHRSICARTCTYWPVSPVWVFFEQPGMFLDQCNGLGNDFLVSCTVYSRVYPSQNAHALHHSHLCSCGIRTLGEKDPTWRTLCARLWTLTDSAETRRSTHMPLK